MTCVVNSVVDDSFVVSSKTKSQVVLTTCYTVQWNLCNLTPEFADILWHPTKIMVPKYFC